MNRSFASQARYKTIADAQFGDITVRIKVLRERRKYRSSVIRVIITVVYEKR